jgi:hypothetical protein
MDDLELESPLHPPFPSDSLIMEPHMEQEHGGTDGLEEIAENKEKALRNQELGRADDGLHVELYQHPSSDYDNMDSDGDDEEDVVELNAVDEIEDDALDGKLYGTYHSHSSVIC